MSNATSVFRNPIDFLKKTVGASGRPLIQEIKEGTTSPTEKRIARKDRAVEAAAAGKMRAARGRGRGYRSLLSESRMEQQGKGTKTTLGG